MRTLLDDRLAPTTSEFGLVQADCESVVEWWVQRDKGVHGSRGISVKRARLSGDLEANLRQLMPLTSVERRRFLFVPTASNWTAAFDNGWQGGDAAGLALTALELRCEAIRIVAIPATRGRYGARIFELYAPETTDFLNYRRTISVANDGGRWRFDQAGEPLEEEDESWYAPRSARNRFQAEHLWVLLSRLGHNLFEPSFFRTTGELLERHGPRAAGSKDYQLSEVQATWR